MTQFMGAPSKISRGRNWFAIVNTSETKLVTVNNTRTDPDFIYSS